MNRLIGPLDVAIVGAGNVGSALGVLLHRRGHRIVAVISRSRRSCTALARRVRCSLPSTSLESIPSSTQFLLIATPDDVVERAAAAVARIGHLRFERLVVAHTSGALTSEALQPLAAQGALVFSFHPLQTFPGSVDLDRQVSSMRTLTYGVEGNPSALRFARRLVRQLGGRSVSVPKEGKILYHLACVFASNYPVVLLHAVEELSRTILPPPSLRYFRTLIETSVANALACSPSRALTGPLARGSVVVLKRHLEALRKTNKRLDALYRAVALYALEGMKEEKKLPDATVRRMRRVLKGKR